MASLNTAVAHAPFASSQPSLHGLPVKAPLGPTQVSSLARTCVRRQTLVASARQEDQCRHATSSEAPQLEAPSAADGEMSRRALVAGCATGAAAVVASIAIAVGYPDAATAEDAPPSNFTDMPALRGKDYGKTRMQYPDYVQSPSGLQYKDLREGSGPEPKQGDMVVIDWDGFTIGYYGRIFEARNKAKGGSFEGNDKDFYRFRVGVGEVIPAFEEAIATMKLGGVRRIVVPPEIGYPNNDMNKLGPKPTTFSGQRALDFVLKNQGLIDKTLLFDIELLKIVPS